MGVVIQNRQYQNQRRFQIQQVHVNFVGKKFIHFEHLRKHLIICRGDVGVQLPIFASISSHHLPHTKHTWINVKTLWDVTLCKFETTSYAELMAHKVEKHKLDPLKCQHCCMEFISWVALFDHVKEHRKKDKGLIS